MPDPVLVLETLRDAWQGLPRPVPIERKAAFLQRLLDAGFRRIDVGSFVSRSRVPAMADTDELLARVQAPPDAVFTALVASEGGLQRLLPIAGIREVLVPFSLSETFQRRNTEASRDETFRLVQRVVVAAHGAGRTVYVTISMAFGNNEGDPWDAGELRDWVARFRRAGVDRLGLADTTAVATPASLRETYAAVMDGADWPVPAAHLHVLPERQEEMVAACLDAGVRAFDSALGALGGCQFAKGAESNLSTLPLARQLEARGLATGLPPAATLAALDAEARELARA